MTLVLEQERRGKSHPWVLGHGRLARNARQDKRLAKQCGKVDPVEFSERLSLVTSFGREKKMSRGKVRS